jgi:hypothetical protein
MWQLRRLASDFEMLEIAAQRAGMALACPFASSEEFESATIQARLATIYGPKRRSRRQVLLGIALVILLISLLR